MKYLLWHSIVALIVGAVSYTIAVSGIFRPIREISSDISKWLGELINCPWCTSFWVTLTMILITNIEVLPLSENHYLNIACSTFCIMSLSAVVHFLLIRAYSGLGKIKLLNDLNRTP